MTTDKASGEQAILTPREIDAKLAEAIGCKVVWADPSSGYDTNGPVCGCVPPVDAHRDRSRAWWGTTAYFTKPTWATSGQLIEGLASQGWVWNVQLRMAYGERPNAIAMHVESGRQGYGEADSLPVAVVLAACRALDIEVDQ